MESFLITEMPWWILGVLSVVVSVGLALGGLWLIRRSTKLSTLESHNDVAGFILAVVGVLYAVLLAFVVIAVWSDYDVAKTIASDEATALESLYRDAGLFQGQVAPIRGAIRSYANSVANAEYPSMAASNGDSEATDAALLDVFRAYKAVDPRTTAENVFYDQSISHLNDVEEARGRRLVEGASSLPAPLWVVLLAGAAITIGFTYFFGLSSFRAHGLMVAALAAMIGLTLFLILSLDQPFTGDLSVKADSMRNAIQEFTALDALG